MVPLDQHRIAQVHGNRFNVLEKDETTSEWGRTWGQSVKALGKDKNLLNLVGDLRSPPGNCQQGAIAESIKAMGMDLGQPIDAKGFFGGNFWSQLDAENLSELDDFLPKVASMSDEDILAELAALSDVTSDDIHAQIQADGYDSTQFVNGVRLMAQYHCV